ncbi:T9SS type A sorting domain-containing protein [candidate division KSB1 bacterium]|nr:T9SS type A sorting domain-containing protein [candidate division KSB1 bacterium]
MRKCLYGFAILIIFSALTTVASATISITVTSPNGGETWDAGSTHNITWTSSGFFFYVKIQYTTNYGGGFFFWTTIVDSTANDGSHSWNLPSGVNSSNCRVKIIGYGDGSTTSDFSDENFTIQPPAGSITVTSPNGGEIWMGGTIHTITWNSSNTSGNVTIEYTTNYGFIFTLNPIVSGTPDDGSYTWTVPNGISSTTCRVKIRDSGDGSVYDFSDANFSIDYYKPDLTWVSSQTSMNFYLSFVTINVRVQNQDYANSGACDLGYYISSDPTITTSDTQIGADQIPALSPWGSSDQSIVASLWQYPGTWYVGFIIDYSDAVDESNENNNTKVWTEPITVDEYCNLNADSTYANYQLSSGDLLTINTRVLNEGNVSTGKHHVGYYLSTDNLVTTGDHRIGTVQVPALNAGDQDDQTIGVNLQTVNAVPPLPTGTHTYTVGYLVDYANAVAEDNETDNDFHITPPITFTIAEPLPDLAVDTLFCSYAYNPPLLSVNARVVNEGTANAPASKLGYYLTTDFFDIQPSDVKLGESPVGSLAPGAHQDVGVQNIDISQLGFAPGERKYVTFFADYIEAVTESDEQNNIKSLSIEIEIPLPPELPDWWEYTPETGNNATVILPMSANPNIKGDPLENGDYVGAFTPSGLCCGWQRWQSQNLDIAVWGDNPETPEIDGFQTDELITYRIFQIGQQKEWSTVRVGYSEGTGYYSANAFMMLNEFYAYDAATFLLKFQQGWNMSSINVMPEDLNVESIFEPIVDKLNLMKNNAGHTYIPAYGLNNIGDLDVRQGYYLHVTSAAELILFGEVVPPGTPITLQVGWNMIGYLPATPMQISAALASLGSRLRLVKNGAGEHYVPGLSINDIVVMYPGQGYKVYMHSAATLVYPSGNANLAASRMMQSHASAEAELPDHFRFAHTTGNSATLLIPSEIAPHYSDGTKLAVGDQIGAFNPAGVCCGAAIWNGENMALTLWGDDCKTDSLDGFRMGDAVTLKVWRSGMNEEFPVQVAQQNRQSLRFQNDGISTLAEFAVLKNSTRANELSDSIVPSEFRLLQNYPNPFNPETTIEFHLPQLAEVSLAIYDLRGQLVRTLAASSRQAGCHRIAWDGRNDAGQIVVSGIYYYRIIARVPDSEHTAFSQIKKMIFIK